MSFVVFMIKMKLKRDLKLVIKSILEINKSVLISLKKGRFKGFGEIEDRSMNLEFTI